MKIEILCVGPLEVNCYIISTNKDNAIIIDPGADPDRILKYIKFYALDAKYILNTHGHVDHIGSNAYIKSETGAQLMIHKDDAFMLGQVQDSYIAGLLNAKPSPQADRLLNDGDIIELDDVKLEVIHTPGHTPGGVCFYNENALFTGDTIFVGGIGRTDFPYSDHRTLIRSIVDRILNLPADTVIYPGHNYGITPTSTVGNHYNQYIILSFFSTSSFYTGCRGVSYLCDQYAQRIAF
jgi:hydroxyacylglutathione hydrolase